MELNEKAKYTEMWKHDAYRQVAPGEHVVDLFLQTASPRAGSTILDCGAGTGRAALRLAARGYRVRMLDFADNCLDYEVRRQSYETPELLDFTVHDLTEELPLTAQYAINTDVMEHIPPHQVDLVLGNILLGAQHCFFQISCEDDVCGKLIGQPLHLSVHPYEWWLQKLQSLGAVVHWSKDFTAHCCFYVTSWRNANEITKAGVVNTAQEQIRKNVETNLKGGWKQISPQVTVDDEVMILGGGPSMAEYLDTIVRLRQEGVKIVTLNGAYNWCLDHDIRPSATVLVDARPFNARFVKPVIQPYQIGRKTLDCKYFISSQCDPSVFEGLPEERTYLWHTASEDLIPLLNEHSKDGIWYGVPGGTTVLLRAIPLLRMLGYHRLHLFGCDSCLTDEKHHAYSQPENDGEAILLKTMANGREFRCHGWMLSQAEQFIDLCRALGDEIDLEIYGDGLLKAVVDEAAQLAEEQEFLN